MNNNKDTFDSLQELVDSLPEDQREEWENIQLLFADVLKLFEKYAEEDNMGSAAMITVLGLALSTLLSRLSKSDATRVLDGFYSTAKSIIK